MHRWDAPVRGKAEGRSTARREHPMETVELITKLATMITAIVGLIRELLRKRKEPPSAE